MVLNELNNLRVHGEKITVEEKQDIFNTLFVKGKKVSIKQLEKFFINRGKVAADEKDFLSGIDVETGFKAYLSSYGKFYGVFGEDIKTDDCQLMVERIIFWLTIYGDDKKFVRECIEENYSDKVSKEQLKRILGLKLSDWGNLSKEFLEIQEEGNRDGLSLIQAMWETNENLMELLGTEHNYRVSLDKKCKKAEKSLSEWNIDDLDEMYVSAPVKRMIWQTLKIVNELVEISGHNPDRIFVEMPRGEAEKTRTVSRKDKLSKLYASIKTEEKNWKKDIDEREEASFRSKKLYLYYLQMGRCMYSGEQIDLHKLLTDNTAYDIDHIYPRHFIKDDSIENNLVLVKKEINAAKTDIYPIDQSIRNKQQTFWYSLKEKGFISAEKYNRLTRTSSFSDEERAAFINRQLVETRQGTKVITEILQEAFPDSTIIFSKAGEVSDFRKKYDLIKVRCVNDLHHAKDAYLNVVVGNAYYVKFTANPLKYIKEANKDGKNPLYKYHMDHIFEFDIQRGNELAWNGTGKEYSKTLDTVKKTMARNTVLITKRPYIVHGGITGKDTVYSAASAKKNPEAYIAMSADSRLSDVTKYGGRTSISTQCYCLVAYKSAGKPVLSLEALPIYIGDIENISEEKVLAYLNKALQVENGKKKVTDVVIKYKCIRFNSLLKVDGHLYHIGGKTGAMICMKNAVPLIMPDEWSIYVKKIEKALNSNYFCELDSDGNLLISNTKNIELYGYILKKLQNVYGNKKATVLNSIIDGKTCFERNSIEEQCYTIMRIIEWLGLNCITVDLTRIGGNEKSGYCRLGKKINVCKEAILINQSTTGLKESKIDLLKL